MNDDQIQPDDAADPSLMPEGCGEAENDIDHIYRTFVPMLRQIAERRGVPLSDADDRVHDVFASFIVHRADVRDPGPYLMGAMDALRHPATWQKADGLSRRGNRSESLSAFAARLEAEEAEAERLLRPLLNASSGRFVWVDIPKQRKFCTGGAVRLLCGEAHKTCEKEPLRALSLADAATAIADALPDDLYPRRAVYDLRGVAWKERANANRYHGDLPEALNDLKRAEKAFNSGPAPALGVGIVRYIRAGVMRDQDRLDEAWADARASATVFRDLKLIPRSMSARNIEGMILYRARRFVEARHVFTELLTYGETSSDDAWIARASLNLANCDVEMGNYSEASIELRRARALFAQLGLTTEVTRVDGCEGLLLLASGRRIEAIKRLDAVSVALSEAGMTHDAAFIASATRRRSM